LLSCRIPGDESARVVSCCRLALLHRPGPGRVRRIPPMRSGRWSIRCYRTQPGWEHTVDDRNRPRAGRSLL